MSEKHTVIRLARSGDAGLMLYGEVSAAEIIEEYREKARHELAAAQRVLAAKDHEFQVRVVRGRFVQHLIKELQPGTAVMT